GVDTRRAQVMQRARVGVIQRDRDVFGELPVQADGRLNHIRRVQTRIDPADRLGQSAGLQGIDTGNVWKERRERYDELLLRNAVQPQSRQGQVLAEAIVKQAEAGAQHS